MSGVVLLAGAIGVVQGALAVWLVVRPRRLWQCCSVLAVGVACLLILAVRGDRSRVTQDVILVIFYVTLAFNALATVMDQRAASGLPSPLDRWFRVPRRQS